MKKQKNPVILKAREEGIIVGMRIAQEQTFLFFFEFLEEHLHEIPGIGPKRKTEVMNYFFEKFGKDADPLQEEENHDEKTGY